MTADQFHTRLLDEVDAFQALAIPSVGDPLAALRAVVERHKPVPCGWPDCKTPNTHRICSACGAAHNFPCPDIAAIARELGINGD